MELQEKEKNTTAMIIASQNQDYVDEGLAEYQDQIHKLQSKLIPFRFFLLALLFLEHIIKLLAEYQEKNE